MNRRGTLGGVAPSVQSASAVAGSAIPPTAVEFDNLGKTFQTRGGAEVVALDGVTGTIRPGEFVSLVGPSGCGKSTLLNIVGGLIPSDTGTFQARSPSNGVNAGMVFQAPVLLPWRTALQNVMVPASVGAGKRQAAGTNVTGRAIELLEQVGLADFINKYPDELSGGMQQRVAIARGLLLESPLLLMDEPFSALDEFTREKTSLLLLDLWVANQVTVIFVTHNIFEAVFLSDRVWVMAPRPGRIVADVGIDLPRPRRPDLIGGPEFSDAVRDVRSVLAQHWEEDA